MTKERELLFTIVEQWGNAACNKEQLLKDFVKEQAIAFFEWHIKEMAKYVDYIRSVIDKPHDSQEQLDALNTFEGANTVQRYDLFLQQQATNTDDN